MRKKSSVVFMCIALILLIIGLVATKYEYGALPWYIGAFLCFECSVVIFMCKKYLGITLSAVLTISIFSMLYVISGGWTKLLIIGGVIFILEIGIYILLRTIKSKKILTN